ncbi:hypothetical protein [Pontibacter oryzae]|uniref:Uncharacterized protein n=1 Tax=Pontibacter oryzae TaxID=2304593 RepID=A0A399SK64_9BACT|nr:hypothetical protein [Pontibacter oryzae]RIJ42572.1 hypothetical protein D1627_01555 [Pontibacter oryzae]
MKGNFKNTLTILLMCSVLLGSVSIAFQKRLCQLSGVVITSLSDNDLACCATDSGNSAFRTDSCCTTELNLANLAPVDLGKNVTLRLVGILAPATLMLPAFYAEQEKAFAFSDTSPPHFSYRLLHFIQVFRL